jgi:plastocyanin
MAKKKHKPRQSSARRFLESRAFLITSGAAIVVLLGAIAFFAFSGGGETTGTRVRQEPVITTEMDVGVDVIDRDYEPRDLTVPRGAKVTWKFKGDLPHDVVEDQGAFESPILEKGDEWSLTFENAGTFSYYCTLHHSMQGTVTVAE